MRTNWTLAMLGLALLALPAVAQAQDDPIGEAIGDEGAPLSSVRGEHAYQGDGDIRVMGVDFQSLAEVSQLIITTDGPVEYLTESPRPDQVVLELQNCRLGSGLERRLDTSEFSSAVRAISSYVSRTTGSDVRVVVDLREAVEWEIESGGNGLVLNFPVPASVAASVYQAPEMNSSVDLPEIQTYQDAGEYQESALLRETMIGGGGEIVDPTRALRTDEGIFSGALGGDGRFTGRAINLDMVNADIHNVFRLISHVSGLNIVSSDEVDGTVTVRLVDVPWDQALAAILQAKGLGATPFGDSIIRVAPLEVIRMERDEMIQAEQSRRELQPLAVLTLPLNYSSAEDMEAQVTTVLTDRGEVALDERTNTVIVRDTEEGLAKARALVRAIDTPTPQVLIEARIVEASQSFTRSLGIQWGGHLNFSPATGQPTGLFFPSTVGVSGGQTANSANQEESGGGAGVQTTFTSFPTWVVDLPASGTDGTLALSLGSVTDLIRLDARLSAAEATGEGRVISSPRITTVTNQSASIRQGTRIPYETVSLRGTQVQFVEASLTLNVTPSITQDQTIFLDIEINNDRPDFGNTVNNFPTIEIKQARTVVMVRDGDTTVIGGVYSVVESEGRSMVPGLGRIPLLGWLFKNSSKRLERKELLVFITPTIITRNVGGR